MNNTILCCRSFRNEALLFLAFCSTLLPICTLANQEEVSKNSATWVALLSGQQPSFEVNVGQTDPSVAYLTRGRNYTLFFKQREVVLRLKGPTPLAVDSISKPSTVSLRFVGAAEDITVRGVIKRRETSNYFVGNDANSWVRKAAHFDRVRYEGLYEGIDAVFYGRDGQLEFDFEVSPGADYRLVGLEVSGSDSLRLDDEGNLLIGLNSGDVVLRAPIVYQEVAGKRVELQGGYEIDSQRRIRFQIASYDSNRPLIIDPILVYSTYLGGSGPGDQARDLVVDNVGNTYVTGLSTSPDFPTTAGAYQPVHPFPSLHHAFVTKFDASGVLQWSTFLGGDGLTTGLAIDVDDSGSVYLTGGTRAAAFPTTPGAFDVSKNAASAEDVFVSKLSADGSALLYSTYLGGAVNSDGTSNNTRSFGKSIAVAANGHVYALGTTTAEDFPTTTGAFDIDCGPPATGPNGGACLIINAGDVFLSVLNLLGGGSSDLIYSSYLGGDSYAPDVGDVAVDASGVAYITGTTSATAGFPETSGSYSDSQGPPPGSANAFFMKLDPAGGGSSDLLYATHLGGSGIDIGSSIAIDGGGDAYVIGYTTSTDFPTTAAAFQTSFGGGGLDAFVVKVSPAASGINDLKWATYLGGSNNDYGFGIGIDGAGSVYAAGATHSLDYPILDAIQSVLTTELACSVNTDQGGPPCSDAFVTKLSSNGNNVIYSTFLGGSDADNDVNFASTMRMMDVDSSGNVYITGTTFSRDTDLAPFPTTAGAFQSSHASTAVLATGNAYVVKIGSGVNADAGPDQTEDEGLLVTLDGSASINATNYTWNQIAGPTVSLSSTAVVNPDFTAPFVGTNTTLTFQLIVDDGAGNFSDPDAVNITIVSVNNPPVADAGNDGTIKEGAVATLDGSNSFDPEGDTPLGYSWTQTSGPLVTLVPSNTVVSPTFTAPLGVGNQLIFDLVVDDGKEFSQPDSVVITVVENSPPVADAGPNQTVDEGSLVNLDGTGSSDPDGGDTLSFDWTEPVALDDDTSPTPSFTAPTVSPGGQDLAFDLVVTDDDSVNPKSSDPHQVIVSVRNINDPPSCDLARAVCPDSKINNNDGCTLWPPNHKLIAVSIGGVMDADSIYNDVTLQITGVTQDEPVNSGGDGDTSPDAVIQAGNPADSVLIRAERTGLGGAQENGRVYVVSFTADDGFESCTGSVNIGVPHDRKDTPVDDGQAFDSTQP